MSKLFVDWIAGVMPFALMGVERGFMALNSDADRFALLNLGEGVERGETPHNGYHQAWRLKSGATVQYNGDREEMGINVVYSGQAIQNMPWGDVLKRITKQGYLTRLDVTIDVLDPAFDLEGLYLMVQAGRCDTKAKNVSFIRSSTGQTLYVGKRSSDRMLRIYDKGGEQGEQQGEHWRIEAELKGVAAQSVGVRLVVNSDEGYGVFKAILDAPEHQGYSVAVGASPVVFPLQTLKRRRDTEAWLFGLVARVMADQEKINPGTLEQFMITVGQLIKRS